METTTAMQGLWDLLDSERGIAFILLLITATVLAALHVITPQDWITFAKWLAVTLIGSKTVTAPIESYRRSPTPKLATSRLPSVASPAQNSTPGASHTKSPVTLRNTSSRSNHTNRWR